LFKKNFQSLMTARLINRSGTGDVNGRKFGLYIAVASLPSKKGAHHQPVVHIGWNANLLQDAAKEVLRLSSRQISERNDDRFVVRVIAVDRLSGQEHSLVAF
jgi:hypothetical protein